nr:immunoglobulin light chain junction region [Macaca mulatta]MPN98481.1 immunoglobulin light chain junction region [Macaca mulatta]MPO01365.1 immunoglobulin light chain junction region [Macaca mulatta]MPO02460.1 immunoglobulin light chain junction region [Macaca mulatta]
CQQHGNWPRLTF